MMRGHRRAETVGKLIPQFGHTGGIGWFAVGFHGREELVDNAARLRVVSHRLGVPLLGRHPALDHGAFDAEQRLQFRLQVGLHRRFDRPMNRKANGGKQHDRDDRVEPELLLEEQPRSGERMRNAARSPRHVGGGRTAAAVVVGGATEAVEKIHRRRR